MWCLLNLLLYYHLPSEALHRPSHLSFSIGSVKTIEKKYMNSHDIVGPKSLNVYDFGMKMYTSQPITAQLYLQGGL